MADVDHFKRINEALGHLMGDEVLVRVAQILQAQCRQDDMPFRYGGEEFAIVSLHDDKSSCEKAMERVRQSVENMSLPNVGSITISIGVTQMDKRVFHLESLEHADKALRHSKNTGRNRVTFFDEITDESNEPKLTSVELF